MSTPALDKLRGHLSKAAQYMDHSAAEGRVGKWVIYTVMALILALLLWASIFDLDEITRGSGRIIPSTEVKVVQHLEGGVIRTIKVRIGDQVKAGDELIELDPKRQESVREEARAEMHTVTVEILRFEALLNGSPLVVPKAISSTVDMAAHMRAYKSERARYQAEVGGLDADIGRLQSEYAGNDKALAISRGDEKLTQQTLGMVRRLESSGAVSEYERIKEERDALGAQKERQRLESRQQELRQQIMQAQARRNALVQQYQAERWARLSDLYAKKNALTARLDAADDGVDRAVVRSPVTGVVKNVFVNAAGSVAQAGAPLVEVVPIEDDLLVEAHISPQDIGFINLGQKAAIKVSAFDFSIYGALGGVVEHISADSIATKDHEYYVVRIRIKNGYQISHLAIKPGMTITADIITGQKTVLKYLLKPVIKGMNEAMKER